MKRKMTDTASNNAPPGDGLSPQGSTTPDQAQPLVTDKESDNAASDHAISPPGSTTPDQAQPLVTDESSPALRINSDPDVAPLWEDLRDVVRVPLREALALTCNIDEDLHTAMMPLDSVELDLFDKRLKNARRSVGIGFHLVTRQTEDGPVQEVLLADFARWVVAQSAVSPLWKNLPDEFRRLASVDSGAPTTQEKPLHHDEWSNLLKMVIGLAEALRVPLDHPWRAARSIAKHTQKAGLGVKQSTVYRYLTIAKSKLNYAKIPDDPKRPEDIEPDTEG